MFILHFVFSFFSLENDVILLTVAAQYNCLAAAFTGISPQKCSVMVGSETKHAAHQAL